MVKMRNLLIAAPVALGLLAAPAVAHAEWRGHGGGWGHRSEGWGGGYRGGYGHHGNGGAIAGALLGLGAAAVIGGIIASQPPPVAYAPQPRYYYPQPAYPTPYYGQSYYEE